nr:MAG TPA: hypothetical protein [Caudoviricetes sp.]
MLGGDKLIYTSNEVEKIDLEINQGDDHQITFNLTDDNGDLIDTSDSKFIFGACYRYSDPLAIKCECEVVSNGEILLRLNRDVTSKLTANNSHAKFNKLYYDIQRICNGKAQRIVQGELLISPGLAFKGGEK